MCQLIFGKPYTVWSMFKLVSCNASTEFKAILLSWITPCLADGSINGLLSILWLTSAIAEVVVTDL